MPRIYRFDPEKALNVILWVANRAKIPDFYRISKIIYFADKVHLQKYGRLICGDAYVAMKDGPVPSGVYDIMKSVRGDGYSPCEIEAKNSFEVSAKTRVVPLKDADMDVF